MLGYPFLLFLLSFCEPMPELKKKKKLTELSQCQSKRTKQTEKYVWRARPKQKLQKMRKYHLLVWHELPNADFCTIRWCVPEEKFFL
jgi:hypothetical protein